MLFNSYLFILIFLPILLIGWYGLNHIRRYTLANVFMLGMSLWFYGMFGWQALLMLGVSAVLNYAVSACMTRLSASGVKAAAAIGIVLNLLLLGALKYAAPITITDAVSLAMPVGFSFYTFSQISFLVDRMRGEVTHDDLFTYLLWITYFPKLVEGPIVRYNELRDQLVDTARRYFDPERFARGLILFVLGMGKKVLLADHLAAVADYGFSVLYLDTISMIAVIVSYVLQLYLDFSGFCDMAMGISWMLGIDLPVNFDSPLKATTFGDFWRRWHMTLTRFLTTYVYIPLGGSRCGRIRTVLNVIIVFALSGIWHGEEIHYLVWGLLTGIFVVVYNQVFKKKTVNNIVISRMMIMVVFSITMFFFRSETIGNALIMLRYLFRPLFPGWITTAASQLSFDELYVVEKAVQMVAPSMLGYLKLVEFIVLLAVSLRLVYGRRNAREIAETCQLNSRNAIKVAILLAWCMISLSGVSTFLYFKY